MPVNTTETKPLSPEAQFTSVLDLISELGLPADKELLTRAFKYAERAHRKQTRSNGDPYIGHPISVARILVELRLDTASIATGLLHDTVEDTEISLSDIEERFGKEVALLVDGVTKISKITFQTTEEKQAENFRKMLLAMAKDLRVILVKLADRTHNIRTLHYLARPKQIKIAQETLDIYAPLANRLGLSSLKRELEDLSLRFTKPEVYYRLVDQVAKKRLEREKHIEELSALIKTALTDHGYKNAMVMGRPKHFYSIHKKMELRNLAFEQVFDITGFRILLEDVAQCYGALGMIHSLWTPLPGRIKDYIAIPKPNFYQSLHTTVVGPSGEHIEIQIRTKEMHETAERGIAAHWAYKEQKFAFGKDAEKFSWLTRLLDSNKTLTDPNEFMDSVKLDLFSEAVYVFTPQGKIMEFPAGASPLDFAYAIHTDVGHRCIGARVNSRMVPLKHKLLSGDTVEILTSNNQKPHKDWLKIVKTSRAKSKIRAFIKGQEHERAVATGELIFDKALKRAGLNYKKLLKSGEMKKAAESFSFRNVEDLLSAIGYGKVSPQKVVGRLLPKEEKEVKEEPTQKGPLQKMFDKAKDATSDHHMIKVKGVEDLLVRFARCCSPVPGDSVVGFITRGRGISVHTRNCGKIFDSDPHRLVEIEWDQEQKTKPHVSKIRVVCEDRAGLLAGMSNVIKNLGVNISRAQIASTMDEKAVCFFSIEIRDLSQLRTVISQIEGVDGVISVERLHRKA